MKIDNHTLGSAALGARTLAQAEGVQEMIVAVVGARHERPLGDKGNNQGLITQSGSSYDHKQNEANTNMQDAVLLGRALAKYGSMEKVPYRTPHEAAEDLLGSLTNREQAELCQVWIDEFAPGENKKHITLTFRDAGCGLTPDDVPKTIFQLGASKKNGVDWLQGTFGIGGATIYRNAKAVVLVTRRTPELLAPGEEDLITVAVVQWKQRFTTNNAHYLVTQPWDEDDPSTWAAALPYSFPASELPEFTPGTHLSLIGFDTQNFHRRSGDEKSYDTVFNTRLYRPVMPVGYRNNLVRDRLEVLGGLERRLNDNPGPSGSEARGELPFRHDGTVYKLPIRYRVFSKPGEAGERRNFVASGHVVMITSNGQVHRHWTPQDFRQNTKRLNKLSDRLLVIVEVDALPIRVRSQLFTADRAQFVQSPEAVRLEQEIAAFLDEWPALVDINNAIVREQIEGGDSSRSTIAVAQQIARAFKAKGFTLNGTGGGSGGGKKTPRPKPSVDLFDNPTHFEGPATVQAKVGAVKSVYYELNATNGFIPHRANIEITCDHPDIGDADITAGDLDGGLLRVSVAVSESAQTGDYKLRARIPEWVRTSGALGPEFLWETELQVVDETSKKSPGKSGAEKKKGTSGADEGGLVAVIWRSHDEVDGWRPNTVGTLETISAAELAEMRDEYKELAAHSGDVPTILLNEAYAPLKSYIAARAKELTKDGSDHARDRYAVGAGVAVLTWDAKRERASKAGTPLDDETIADGLDIAARAVLSVLPAADRILRELE